MWASNHLDARWDGAVYVKDPSAADSVGGAGLEAFWRPLPAAVLSCSACSCQCREVVNFLPSIPASLHAICFVCAFDRYHLHATPDLLVLHIATLASLSASISRLQCHLMALFAATVYGICGHHLTCMPACSWSAACDHDHQRKPA